MTKNKKIQDAIKNVSAKGFDGLGWYIFLYSILTANYRVFLFYFLSNYCLDCSDNKVCYN